MKAKFFLLRVLLVIAVFALNLSPVFAQTGDQGITCTIVLKGVDNARQPSLVERGISFKVAAEGKLIASVTKSQMDSLRAQGIQVEILKCSDRIAVPSVTQGGSLSNQYLTLSVIDSGQFTMWTADGKYLLYPYAGTGYLSVKVDSQVYNNRNGSLTVSTPFTIEDANNAYIRYQTPENVLITQRFSLSGRAVRFQVEALNQSGTPRSIAIRYLFDTQVDVNDGSPLYASTVGVRTYETDMPAPSFGSWRGYDIWPNPGLTSVGTFSTQPDRAVFAWWPNAVGYDWDYTPDPNQIFYTPGYTYSPYSDSCVLLYFGMGTVAPGTQKTVATYYGTGEPTGNTDRDRLISAFNRFKEAIKSSMVADLDAFSGIQAKYMVALRPDWKDYLEAAWTIASLTIVPGPDKLAKLGKDATILAKVADVIDAVDLGNTVAKSLVEVYSTIPSSASETQVKNNYIYPHFLNNVTFTPKSGGTYRGVAGYLQTIDAEYQNYLAQIPDPLPTDYPVESVINLLENLTAALDASASRETFVPVYTADSCTLAKLGILQFQKDSMAKLADKLAIASNVSFASTLTSIGAILGGGALKVAGAVGAPVTVGGSTVVLIPSEAVLWGGVANIVLISELVGGASTVGELTIQGAMTKVDYEGIAQLANDLALRHAIFQNTGNWVTSSRPLSVRQLSGLRTQRSSVQVSTISVPNLTVPDGQTAGQGSGQVLFQNTGTVTINVNVYGNITTELGQENPIVGLVGSSTVSVPPGEQRSITFSYTLIRSSLLHYGGYNVHLFITEAGSGSVDIQGPFVAHFYVGTASQLATLSGQSFSTTARGSLVTGQSSNYAVQFASATQLGRLLLSFAEGSDYDLHLYDASGRHVGVNYTTGQVENQIPGVSYSGATTWPEWMVISNPGTATYQVKVIAQNSAGGTGYDLSKLETPMLSAILDAPATTNWSIYRLTRSSPKTESFGLQIAEGGGSQNISNLQLLPTSFSGNGTTIPASQITCSAPTTIQAGSSVLGNCTVTVPAGAPAGTVTGAIQISGKDMGGNALTRTTQVSLALAEPNWNIYLPLIAR
jgi:hypothetical protein